MHVHTHTHAHGESVEHCYRVSHGVTTSIRDTTLVQLQCVVGDGGHSMSKIFHGPNVAASRERHLAMGKILQDEISEWSARLCQHGSTLIDSL